MKIVVCVSLCQLNCYVHCCSVVSSEETLVPDALSHKAVACAADADDR